MHRAWPRAGDIARGHWRPLETAWRRLDVDPFLHFSEVPSAQVGPPRAEVRSRAERERAGSWLAISNLVI